MTAAEQVTAVFDYWPGLRLIGCWKGGTVGVRLSENPAHRIRAQRPRRDQPHRRKLHVNQLMQAMAEAERATGIRVRHYRRFADSEKSRYASSIGFSAIYAAAMVLR